MADTNGFGAAWGAWPPFMMGAGRLPGPGVPANAMRTGGAPGAPAPGWFGMGTASGGCPPGGMGTAGDVGPPGAGVPAGIAAGTAPAI